MGRSGQMVAEKRPRRRARTTAARARLVQRESPPIEAWRKTAGIGPMCRLWTARRWPADYECRAFSPSQEYRFCAERMSHSDRTGRTGLLAAASPSNGKLYLTTRVFQSSIFWTGTSCTKAKCSIDPVMPASFIAFCVHSWDHTRLKSQELVWAVLIR